MKFFIKTFFYKLKMCSKFWKHLHGSWECVDVMLNIPMEIFCDFYREEFIKNNYVDWEAADEKMVKEIMSKIYYYWKTERLSLEKRYERALTNWSEEHDKITSFVKIENSLCYKMEVAKSDSIDLLNKIVNQLEEELETKDRENLNKLMSIREYMWT